MMCVATSLFFIGWVPIFLPLLEKWYLIIAPKSEVLSIMVMVLHVAVGLLFHSGFGIPMNPFFENNSFPIQVQAIIDTVDAMLVIDPGINVPYQS
jgi:hypothetical protein